MRNIRPALGSIAAMSLLFVAACSGPDVAADAPVDTPAPAAEVGGVSDGGGGDDVSEGDNDQGEGMPSSGSPLGDANRMEYLDAGAAPDEVDAIAWAGDVNNEDGSFVEYPDGLRIDFAGVTEGSAPISEESGDLNPDKSLVRVALTVSNSGPDALPLDGDMTAFNVFEGENLVAVDSHVGYFGEEDDLYSADDAQVIASGSTLDVYMSYEVDPGAALEVEIRPEFFGYEHSPFVFYGITAP